MKPERIQLLEEPDGDAAEQHTERVERRIQQLPDWSAHLIYLKIIRRFEFPDSTSALGFVERVAQLSSRMDRHPAVTIHGREVALELPAAGQLREIDLDLAIEIDRLTA